MSLMRMDTMLREARQRGQAVPGFECWDSGSVQAIAQASVATGLPVIFQASPTEYTFCGGPEALRAIVEWYVCRHGITAALHLDHGSTLEHVGECLRGGFTSVMLDASRLPYHENVRLTRQAAEMAREHGASSEAELGHVGGFEGDLPELEEDESTQTDPTEAEEFVAETGTDCLAVAIGTIHGSYRGKPKINVDRLRQIADRVTAPLVLHGGSMTPDNDIRACIRHGIAKVNICTELQQAWLEGLDESRKINSISVPGKFYTPPYERMLALMVGKLQLFASG